MVGKTEYNLKYTNIFAVQVIIVSGVKLNLHLGCKSDEPAEGVMYDAVL
jgi:hypothetical protein